MIPRSLFAIHYVDRVSGSEGMEFLVGPVLPCCTSREDCEAYIAERHLDVRQICTVVEWRLVEHSDSGKGAT